MDWPTFIGHAIRFVGNAVTDVYAKFALRGHEATDGEILGGGAVNYLDRPIVEQRGKLKYERRSKLTYERLGKLKY
jgi:hypothetical protein